MARLLFHGTEEAEVIKVKRLSDVCRYSVSSVTVGPALDAAPFPMSVPLPSRRRGPDRHCRHTADDVDGLTFGGGGEHPVPALELAQVPEDAAVASVAADDCGIAGLTESGCAGDVTGTRDGLARTGPLHHGLIDSKRGDGQDADRLAHRRRLRREIHLVQRFLQHRCVEI